MLAPQEDLAPMQAPAPASNGAWGSLAPALASGLTCPCPCCPPSIRRGEHRRGLATATERWQGQCHCGDWPVVSVSDLNVGNVVVHATLNAS